MGVTQEQLLNLVDENLKFTDTTVLSEDSKKELINEAVDEYSRLRPHRVLEVKTGNSTGVYDLPTDWQDGISTIDEVEYPVENNPKTFIPDVYYYVEQYGDEGLKLRFDYSKPANGAIFWLRYTKLYLIDSNGDSDIPANDKTGLAYLATSVVCSALATFYGSKANPSIPGAEVIGYESRVEEWTNRATKWMKKFHSTIKQEITGVHGSVGFIDESYWDRTNA